MRPRLIHPVTIGIQILDREESVSDDDFGDAEPVYGETIEVQGQVRMASEDKFQPSPGGDNPVGEGHIVFRAVDLETAEIELSKGDQIVSITGREDAYTVIEVAHRGTYSGSNHLVFCFIEKERKQ